MNLDVSPDGKQIVFDLLGDIYVMPIDGSGGGAATRIAGGAAFDMQPRFSPDGKRIAFSSDRDGLWNIWTMDVDGKNPRQISRDRRWFVNSPTWSPDGELHLRAPAFRRRALARRRRDLDVPLVGAVGRPAGHGADRLPERQRRARDLARRPLPLLQQGRHARPRLRIQQGSQRHDLRDHAPRPVDRPRAPRRQRPGRIGDAAVSPDGKTLAYIRRQRLQSFLYLRDLETGRDRQLFGNIDKDLQEAWAVHGLYPQYAWTPDGKSIVIWGEGKIWRVDAASGKGQPDPVHGARRADDQRRRPLPAEGASRRVPGADAARRPRLSRRQDRGLQRARASLLAPAARRPAAAAHEGRALRVLSVVLPRRSVDRLHDVVGRRDGSRARRSSRTAAAGGTSSRKPGHYVEPSFSPDGQKIVFRHAGGDITRGVFNGEDAGIYVVADSGGEPILVREGGSEPEFDHTGTRIYFREVRDGNNTLLSVGVPAASDRAVPGRDEIEHVRSANATQFAVSPNGEWIAFEERFKTFIAPFPRTGRVVEIGQSTQAYPVQRVSRDAGFFLHWSGDSRRLYWTLGPELFTRDLARTFTFVEGGQREGRRARSQRASTSGSPRRATNPRRGRARRRARRSRWPASSRGRSRARRA